MNNFPIYLVFRSDKINISVDETPAKFHDDTIWIFYAPILRLNKCQIWQQDFDYIQCKQTFDTVTKISVNNRQNSTQENAVKLKTRQQRVKATVNRLTTS